MKLFLLALFVAAANASPIPEDSGPVEVVVQGVPEGHALEVGDIVDIKVKEHVDGEVVAETNVLHPFTAVGIAEAAAIVAAAQEETVVESPLPEISAEPVILPALVSPEVALPEIISPEVEPESVVLPSPPIPEVVPAPEPVALPSPPTPEVAPGPASPEVALPEIISPEVEPEPVVLPSPPTPEVIPEPVVLPSPPAAEVIPEPVVLPEPAVPEVIVDPSTPDIDIPAVPLPVPAPQAPEIPGELFNDGLVSVTVNTPEDSGVLSTLQSWFNMVLNYVNIGGVSTTQQII